MRARRTPVRGASSEAAVERRLVWRGQSSGWIEADAKPRGITGELEVAREVGKLFDLGGQHGKLLDPVPVSRPVGPPEAVQESFPRFLSVTRSPIAAASALPATS